MNITSDDASGPLCSVDRNALPSCIATPLQEVFTEEHPVLRLWRVCDTCELLLRLCVAIRVAEVRGCLPDAAAAFVLARIERPTFAQWFEVAKHLAACATVDPSTSVVSELEQAFDADGPIARALWGKLGRKERSDGLISLRNELAHGAGYGRAAATKALSRHAHALGNMLLAAELQWLLEIELYAVLPDATRVLMRGPWFGRPDHKAASARLEAGHFLQVQMRRGPHELSLWPLQAWGPGFGGDVDGPLVYRRCGTKRLEMSSIGVQAAESVMRGPAFDRFAELFRVGERATLLQTETAGFNQELRDESERFVGRHEQVELLADWFARSSGVALLRGVAGIGKSALMARLFTEVSAQQRDALLVAWRFRAGDPRCTSQAFFRHAVDTLDAGLGRGGLPSRSAQSDKDLEKRLARLLQDAAKSGLRVAFLLDGVDEIARSQEGFLDVPFRHEAQNVVWLCAGRPDPCVLDAFAGRCVQLPLAELGPMSAEDVSFWLKRDLTETARNDLVQREPDGRVAAWIDTVVVRSGGLAAYVSMLLEDVNDGVLEVGARSLPRGLPEYFERRLAQVGVGSVDMVVPPLMAAICVAVEAPDRRIIFEILRRSAILREAKDEVLVDEALARLQSMLHTTTGPAGATYLPWHDELGTHIRTSSTQRLPRDHAVAGWKSLCLQPKGAHRDVERCALEIGIRQLLALGYEREAVERFVEPKFQAARRRLEGVAGPVGLLADLAAVHSMCTYREELDDDLDDRYMAFLVRAGSSTKRRPAYVDQVGGERYEIGLVAKLGERHRRSLRLDEAMKVLRRGIKRNLGEGRPRSFAAERALLYYEIAFVHHLRGQDAEAGEAMAKSQAEAQFADDVVGVAIAKCVGAAFAFHGGRELAEDFARLCASQRPVFERERWHPAAHRWEANTFAHEFDACWSLGQTEACHRLLKELQEHPWIQRHGEHRVLLPRQAMVAELDGDLAAGVRLLREFLESSRTKPEAAWLDGLARWHLRLGDMLFRLGKRDQAKLQWQRACDLPPDAGNRAWQRAAKERLDSQPARTPRGRRESPR
jgi:tetratricopeptide (TPR) repeat protein